VTPALDVVVLDVVVLDAGVVVVVPGGVGVQAAAPSPIANRAPMIRA
jgi:hypothetical protein